MLKREQNTEAFSNIILYFVAVVCVGREIVLSAALCLVLISPISDSELIKKGVSGGYLEGNGASKFAV